MKKKDGGFGIIRILLSFLLSSLSTVLESPFCATEGALGAAAIAASRQSFTAFRADEKARTKCVQKKREYGKYKVGTFSFSSARFLPVCLFGLNKFLSLPEFERESSDALGDLLVFYHRKRRSQRKREEEERGDDQRQQQQEVEIAEILPLAKATLLPLIEAMGKSGGTEGKVRVLASGD